MATRTKIIHKIKCKIINDHFMILELVTQAGTYPLWVNVMVMMIVMIMVIFMMVMIMAMVMILMAMAR